MRQTTLSDLEYSNRRRPTRRDKFLDAMEALIPWADWVNRIRPYYPAGKRGRPPRDIEMMLRMYLLQDWFHLSGEGIEDAIYDSYAMRKFMRIDFMDQQVPASSTLLRFRHLMEDHRFGEYITADIRDRLRASGRVMRRGKMTDPTIVSLPKESGNSGTSPGKSS